MNVRQVKREKRTLKKIWMEIIRKYIRSRDLNEYILLDTNELSTSLIRHDSLLVSRSLSGIKSLVVADVLLEE